MESVIKIHEHLITVLKEKFKGEFGVAVEDASDSVFTDQKIELFKQKVYVIGDIVVKDGIKADSIKKKFKRALVFEEDTIGGVTIGQYDEVCCFLLSKKLEECNKDYGIGKIVRTVRSLENSRRIGKQTKATSPLHLIGEQQTLKIKIDGVLYFDGDFWNAQKGMNTKEQVDLINRYYTYIDTNQISKAVANDNFIIEPQETFLVTDSEKNTEPKTINQTIEQSTSESFSLIKILGEGGIGKSTFLYWIGKNYFLKNNIFLIKRIYENTTDLLINECFKISKYNSKPLVFLIDDIAEYDKSRKIFDFIVKIKENLSTAFQILVIVAERKARYNSQIGTRKLDIHFSGNVQLIDFIPANKKEIFFKIYSILLDDNSQLKDDTLKQEAENVFLDESVFSISESIFKLLLFLKYKSNINYDFDWDDWDKFIKDNSEYQSIENLFIAVVCFYQFGIMMPITYQCMSLQGANRVKIRKAINSFGSEISPIRLTDDDKEEDTKLFLKHEYVAAWFLYDEARKSLVKDFFKDFISSINTNEAGWLLRQFRKLFKSPEFLTSGLQDLLDEEKYLSLIDNYIKIPTISDRERTRMQMEKGIILLKKGETNNAKDIFQSLENNPESYNHSRDQLAKIYLKTPETYQLAFEKYLQIFRNGGVYAIVQIYKVLRLCKKNNVHIQFENNSDFSSENIFAIANKLTTYEYHEAIREFILSDEFDLAENLLQRMERPQNITADCYNLLANSIPFSNETTERKERLFLKAIEIDTTLNPDEEDFQLTIDYAVFLYRIRKFPESLTTINNFLADVETDLKLNIENRYWNAVRNTKKLFFTDLPKSNQRALETYLIRQYNDAVKLVSLKEQNINNIVYGYLILQTVKYHSRIPFPHVFYNAARAMAYCYMQNAEKKWNNIGIRENRIIAEKYYDKLLDEECFLNKNDYANMVKNLLNFEEREKAIKAISLIKFVLQNYKWRSIPTFYRLRGNAKKQLEEYNESMKDYQKAYSLCIPTTFDKSEHYINETSYVLNNIAQLICYCFELGITLEKYNLVDALKYCNDGLKLRPDFQFLTETKTKVEALISNN